MVNNIGLNKKRPRNIRGIFYLVVFILFSNSFQCKQEGKFPCPVF